MIKHSLDIVKLENQNKRILYALDSYNKNNKSVGTSSRLVGYPKYTHHRNSSEAESSQDMWNSLSTSGRNKEFNKFVQNLDNKITESFNE